MSETTTSSTTAAGVTAGIDVARSSTIEQRARGALTAALADAADQPAVANFIVRGADLLSGQPFAIDFEREVADEVISDVLAYTRRLADLELVPYDPSFQPSSGQALVDSIDDAADFGGLHSLIIAGTAELDRASAGHPRPDGHHGDDVGHDDQQALVHRVDGPGGLPIVAYRVKGPGIATRRPRGIRILVPRDGVWERVPDELIYYQPRFDAIVVADVVIVTAPTVLQRNLGSEARAQKMARETFRTATTGIDIEGSTDLADAIGSDPAMIAKMAQLSRTLDSDPGYADFLTTERILAFLDDNPQIPIATAGEGSARHLVFESSPQKRYLIPKTLADDFLRSELTHRRYEAGSKQRIDG